MAAVIDPQRELAARVAARSQIQNVLLVNGQFEVLGGSGIDSGLSYDLNVDSRGEWSLGAPVFSVTCEYQLSLKSGRASAADESDADTGDENPSGDGGEFARIAFRLLAIFGLELREGDEPPTEDELAAYAATTGAFALYPFAREYVRDLTGRMGLPPLVLGVSLQPIAKSSDDELATADTAKALPEAQS